MEVHTHSHVTHKKKFGEYLLEFFMLFLAVFLGFVAENIREHAVEQKRAGEYAKNLLVDLRNDTAEIKRTIFYDSMTNRMIDSLVQFTNSSILSKKTGQLYYYMRLSAWLYITDWSKATIDQLLNSGNLRLFTEAALVSKLSDYHTLTSTISSIQNTIEEHRNRATIYRDRILRSGMTLAFQKLNMDDLSRGISSPYIDSLRNADIPLHNSDPDLINSYTNAILATRSNRVFLLTVKLPKAIGLAAEIMELLKKEYHLEKD